MVMQGLTKPGSWGHTAADQKTLGPYARQEVYRQCKKLDTLLDLCVSSLRRGHANLLCIVPILTDDPRRESDIQRQPAAMLFC